MTRHSMRSIVRAVAIAGGMPAPEITSARKPTRHVLLRWAVIRIARAQGLSLPRIGQGLGGRDHTTVLHGLRAMTRMGNRRAEDLREIRRVTALAERILAGERFPELEAAVSTRIPEPPLVAPSVAQCQPRLPVGAPVAHQQPRRIPAPGAEGRHLEAQPVRDGERVRQVTRSGYVAADGTIVCNP